jgi:O-antigen ligase
MSLADEAGTADRRQGLVVFGLFVLSLACTITNAVPFSLLFVLLVPAVPYLLLKNRSLPGSVVALLTLFAYFAINTLFYAPVSFAEPAFYRRDGNVFVTFLPMVIGGALVLRNDVEGVIMGFLEWATLADALFICVYLATGGTLLFREPGVYHFLFEAHNAAGGFLSMVVALALGMYSGRRKTVLLGLILLVNFLGLILTVSRGSALGVALAVILVLMLKERFIKTTVVGSAVVMIALLSVTYPMWVGNGKPAGAYQPGEAGLMSTEELAGDTNTLDRVLFLWPRALDNFLQSPLVGTGFGSYDDLPYRFGGIPHVLSFNQPIQMMFTAAHAHNTYMHVLGETGALGLALLLWMLNRTWRDIDSLEPRSVRLSLKLAFWVAVFSSFTEHRLFTPAQMLPFTMIMGLALANQRAMRRQSQQASVTAALPDHSA